MLADNNTPVHGDLAITSEDSHAIDHKKNSFLQLKSEGWRREDHFKTSAATPRLHLSRNQSNPISASRQVHSALIAPAICKHFVRTQPSAAPGALPRCKVRLVTSQPITTPIPHERSSLLNRSDHLVRSRQRESLASLSHITLHNEYAFASSSLTITTRS